MILQNFVTKKVKYHWMDKDSLSKVSSTFCQLGGEEGKKGQASPQNKPGLYHIFKLIIFNIERCNPLKWNFEFEFLCLCIYHYDDMTAHCFVYKTTFINFLF